MFVIARNEKNTRMCCVCRGRFPKNDLTRICKYSDGVDIDPAGNAPGRGAYICHSPECIQGAQKKNSLSRSLKTRVDDWVYMQLSENGK